MKNLIIALTLLLIAGSSFAQQKFNPVLKKQLDSVLALDQKYRDTLTWLMTPGKSDSVLKAISMSSGRAMSHYWGLQNRIDSANVVFVEQLFKKYSYPGKTLVGEPTNEAAWYVIQHSPKINQYMPLMKTAAENKELPFRLYAMMLDRQLMNEGKEQIYGSQATSKPLRNGQKVGYYVWPIKDAATVNERRKQAGFDQTVEENAKRLGIDYKVVKIEDVK
ncbi:DUF6624 domain-containing protein [Mucilaginibacter sp. cycad4]|uniref:DUF6624 domain-containing protein n=1 Tax=Mucilaginibacter sp. cycad4 TaxID=3342096 RepID=UPI002AAB71EA|nr:DUF6624 domain-containing protein [Mucilaginibacter gossypii]WPU99524.1 DUF6624 domain-containing protein [Mucilaginibacter gossypii]